MKNYIGILILLATLRFEGFSQKISVSIDTVDHVVTLDINKTTIQSGINHNDVSELLESKDYRIVKNKKRKVMQHGKIRLRNNRSCSVTFDSLGISFAGKSSRKLTNLLVNFQYNCKDHAVGYPNNNFKGQLIINGISIDYDKSVLTEAIAKHIIGTENQIPSQDSFIQVPLLCTIDLRDPHKLECQYTKSNIYLHINRTTGMLNSISFKIFQKRL